MHLSASLSHSVPLGQACLVCFLPTCRASVVPFPFPIDGQFCWYMRFVLSRGLMTSCVVVIYLHCLQRIVCLFACVQLLV